MAHRRRGFGHIRRLPSGRYQASYVGPDTARYTAPSTFSAGIDAEGWLIGQRRLIEREEWRAPTRAHATAQALTIKDYADSWLDRRDLKPRTRAHYRALLDTHILAALGDRPLRSLTPSEVAAWHAGLSRDTPTLRAHAYSLLKAVYRSAVDEELVSANPCRVRGAGTTKRKVTIEPATPEQLLALTAAMPERLQVMVLLASWCGLRFGELAELRRKDIDLTNEIVHVRRGVVFVDGAEVVGTPKSAAGRRNVAIPPHLLPAIRAHLSGQTDPGPDALLFPAADGADHLRPSTLYRSFYPARVAAGRPDLRFHDLRHTGAVLAASTGATLAELMARLGHSTPAAAMRYQHAASERDRAIAARLSDLATGLPQAGSASAR